RGWDPPFLRCGKGYEKRPPILGRFIGLAGEDFIQRRTETLAAYRLKSRIILQALQVRRPFDGPGRGPVPVDPIDGQSVPNRTAHEPSRVAGEGAGDAHPPVRAKVLDRAAVAAWIGAHQAPLPWRSGSVSPPGPGVSSKPLRLSLSLHARL